MVAKPRGPKATYDDVLAAPEHMIAEILGGELVLHPRPTIAHQGAATELAVDLGGTVGRLGPPDGWSILRAVEVHFGPRDARDVVVPDLAGWRRTRMPKRPDAAFITLAPDWVCEVLSPGTELRDRTDKLAIYGREGVGHLWFVSVRTRHVEVYRLVVGFWTLVATAQGDGVVRLEPFEEVELTLGRLWTDDAGAAAGAPGAS